MQKNQYLGALWGKKCVYRNPEIDKTLKLVISSIRRNMTLKEHQQARGYLNYYLSFAGHVHAIVNRALSEPEEGKVYYTH